MLNTVVLMGRVGQDPQVISFQNGGRVVRFSVATSQRFKGEDGQVKEFTQWHNVETGKSHLIGFIEQHIKKGSLVTVQGMIKYEKFTDKSNVERTLAKIVFDTIINASSKELRDQQRNEANAAGTPVPSQDDDLPF